LSTVTLSPAPRRLRAGLALVGILVAGANLRASITTVGPLLDRVRDDLDLSSTTASALISLPVLCFGVFSPVAPAVARRLGLEPAITLALSVLCVGVVARSVPWVPALWIGTALLGLGIAFVNVLLPAVVRRDFPHAVGRLTGTYSVAQSALAALGAGLAVPIAGLSDHGWRLAFGVWAGLALLGVAVFLPQLRGAAARRADAAGDAAATADAVDVPHRLPWRSMLAWQVTLFMGLQSMVYYTLIGWWPSIEESHGVTSSTAGAHMSVLQVASIAGNILTGWVVQRWSRDQRLLLAGLSTLYLVAVSGELAVPGLGLLWSAVAGVGGGGLIVLALALFGLRTRHHEQAAALSGMAQSCGYLIAAAGPIVVGAVHDATSDWTVPLVILIAVLVGQLVAGLGACRHRYL